MGVWGLTSALTPDHNNGSNVSLGERLCLSEEAARRRAMGEAPLTIIIDGTGFLLMVWRTLGPKWEWALGGELGTMQRALKEFIAKLTRGGVELMVSSPTTPTFAEIT